MKFEREAVISKAPFESNKSSIGVLEQMEKNKANHVFFGKDEQMRLTDRIRRLKRLNQMY